MRASAEQHFPLASTRTTRRPVGDLVAGAWQRLARTLQNRRILAALLAPPPGTSWAALAFALRTTAASLIALYIAFLMQMDSPKWAAMTVWIVAQGSRGMSLSKGRARVFGTLVGATMGVALIAAFAQTPALLLLALSLWLGLCTAIATGLRNFRSYGAVLAGYTAAIVAMDAATAPDSVFDIAVARATYVILGIVVEAVMAAIFAPGAPVYDVMRRLGAFIADTARTSRQALSGQPATHHQLAKLFADALALETVADYAAAAVPGLRPRLGHLRAATGSALWQLSAARTLLGLARMDPDPATLALVGETDALLLQVASARHTPAQLIERLDTLRGRVAAALDKAATHPGKASGSVAVLDPLESLLDALREALARARLLTDPKARPSRLRFALAVDHQAALRNGIRATLAMLGAAAIWILTAWPAGSGFVVIVGVVCALFATREDPAAGSQGFLRGTIFAVSAAALCNFVLLPRAESFPELAFVLGAFLLTGGIAMRTPRWAGPAAAFSIFFLDLVGPVNAARTQAADFLNGGLALVLGIFCGVLVFGLLFPPDPAAARARLRRAMIEDLQRIGRAPGEWSRIAWLGRIADRAARQLAVAARSDAATAEADFRFILDALAIGNDAQRLHALRAEAAMPNAGRAAIATVLRRVARLSTGPERAAATAHVASIRLLRLAQHAEPASARVLARAFVTTERIAATTASQAAALAM